MLKTKAAAARLEVSPLTLRRWVHTGWGPPVFQTPTGAWRFDEGDLNQWIEDHKQLARPLVESD